MGREGARGEGGGTGSGEGRGGNKEADGGGGRKKGDMRWRKMDLKVMLNKHLLVVLSVLLCLSLKSCAESLALSSYKQFVRR